jgi:membrane-bound serine protease (ClpP class)
MRAIRAGRGVLAAVILLAAAAALLPASAGAGERVAVYRLEGVINPPAASYLAEGIRRSNREGDGLILILLDTPGGLDTAMREIVKEIMGSARPVAVYVHPRGARAASAGVFLTMAAHLAGMAPGTNIGAAHPVGVGGAMEGDARAKAENDAAAYLRSIAEARGRDAAWAEEAVRKSVSLTEKEALEKRVVDLVAPDLQGFLEAAHGRRVTTAAGPVTLDTLGAGATHRPMPLRWRILHTLSKPDVAYLLMMLGIAGLFMELSHPGAVLPGVVGALSLILGLYGLQTLPLNYAGFLLILLAVVLFVVEIKVVSYGLLSLGGIASMILGSLMLVDSPLPFLRVSLATVLSATAAVALILIFLAGAAARALARKPQSGMEGLLGRPGEALGDLTPRGKIFIHGEIWDAVSSTPVPKGGLVTVTGHDGLTLRVEPHPTKEV